MKVPATNDQTHAITVFLDGNTGNVGAGGNGVTGSLKVVDKDNVARLVVAASAEGVEEFGANVILQGDSGQLILAGSAPSIVIFPTAGIPNQNTIVMDGKLANIRVGGPGVDGDIALYPASSTPADLNDFSKGSILLDGQRGNISAKGDILLGNGTQNTIVMDGKLANIRVGGPGVDGDIALYPANSTPADLNDFSKGSIFLDGQRGNISAKGDILLDNADCAEDFYVSPVDYNVDPGTVMVIEEENRIRRSSKPYDKRVAGVISGAGSYKPAIILDKKRTENNRMPVALLGKAFCKVDAGYGAIEVGDLLTTSSTPGHAMKASEAERSFGAVIGKALSPLMAGQGLIPILIALQ